MFVYLLKEDEADYFKQKPELNRFSTDKMERAFASLVNFK